MLKNMTDFRKCGRKKSRTWIAAISLKHREETTSKRMITSSVRSFCPSAVRGSSHQQCAQSSRFFQCEHQRGPTVVMEHQGGALRKTSQAGASTQFTVLAAVVERQEYTSQHLCSHPVEHHIVDTSCVCSDEGSRLASIQ